MKCPHCGIEAVAEAMYCPECGNALSEEFTARQKGPRHIRWYIAIVIAGVFGAFLYDPTSSFIIALGGVFLVEEIIAYRLNAKDNDKWRDYSGIAKWAITFAIGLSFLLIHYLRQYREWMAVHAGWFIAGIGLAFLVERIVAHRMKQRFPEKWEIYSITARYALISLFGLSFALFNSSRQYSAGYVEAVAGWVITGIGIALLIDTLFRERIRARYPTIWKAYSPTRQFFRGKMLFVGILLVIGFICAGISIAIIASGEGHHGTQIFFIIPAIMAFIGAAALFNVWRRARRK